MESVVINPNEESLADMFYSVVGYIQELESLICKLYFDVNEKTNELKDKISIRNKIKFLGEYYEMKNVELEKIINILEIRNVLIHNFFIIEKPFQNYEFENYLFGKNKLEDLIILRQVVFEIFDYLNSKCNGQNVPNAIDGSYNFNEHYIFFKIKK